MLKEFVIARFPYHGGWLNLARTEVAAGQDARGSHQKSCQSRILGWAERGKLMQVGCKSGARSVQSGAVVEKCYLTANSKIVAGGRVMKVKCGRFVLGWARWARWLPCNRLSIVQTLKRVIPPRISPESFEALKLEATAITRIAQICAMTGIVYLVFALTALWLGGPGPGAGSKRPLACRVGTAQEPASGACSSPFFEKLWSALRSGR